MGRKYKSYKPEDMEKAIEMVRSGCRKKTAASNVPKSTLKRRLKRDAKKQEWPPTLSRYDETQLAKYAQFMSNCGHPVTPEWLCETAGRLASQRLITEVYILNCNVAI